MPRNILTRLGPADLIRLKNSAKTAQRIENKWDAKIRAYLESTIDTVIGQLEIEVMPTIDLERMLIEHYFDAQIEALKLAEAEKELEKRPSTRLGITFPRRGPKTLAEIMARYDAWRKGQYKPKLPMKEAKKIQRDYLKKVKSVWEQNSKPFREGDVYTQERVKEQIRRAAKTATSRAQTIIRTETTNYYNEARRRYYDQSPDVVAYLVLAIRDKRTTRWCSEKTTDGKRGRHGLVYMKDSEVFKREGVPAYHWNCRSEIVPLTMENTNHRKLIEDLSIRRDRVACHPLPLGWVASRAA